jgi:hypothetical protein
VNGPDYNSNFRDVNHSRYKQQRMSRAAVSVVLRGVEAAAVLLIDRRVAIAQNGAYLPQARLAVTGVLLGGKRPDWPRDQGKCSGDAP